MSIATTRRALLLVPLCLTILLTACETGSRGEFQRLSKYPPAQLYDRGRRALRAHDYTSAVANYEALTARYPFTAEARQGRLDVIFAYYKLDEKESARDAADTFIKENPQHKHIDYAYYLKGLIDFERTPLKLELWLGGDPTARPPQTAADSIESMRTVIEKYPKSIYANDARRRMIYMRNRLADYQLRVADYYLRRGAWVAAAQRARQAIEEYDGSPAVKDALRILIVCYKELDYAELADNTRKVFQQNFPGESSDVRVKRGVLQRLFTRESTRTASAN
jgi:outer membrane protein assembly factor BamD